MDLGPGDGRLTVATDVEGAAARVGHRLLIGFGSWKARVDFRDGDPVRAALDVDLDSFEVLSGEGGVTPLTALDRSVIKRNALKTLQADAYPTIRFTAADFDVSAGRVRMGGDVQIHGQVRAVRIDVDVSARGPRTTISGSVRIRQSDFGVKPYSLMLGQLRVADEVVVALEADFPSADLG